MDLKFIIFWGALLVGCPLGILLALYYRKFERFLFVMLIFMTASTFPWGDINFVSMEWYRGTTRGFELTILDLTAIMLLGVCLLSPRLKKKFTLMPYNFPVILALIFSGLLSILLTQPQIYGYFELFKWIRGAFLYLVVVNYVREEADFRLIIYALMGVIGYEALVSIKLKFIDHLYRIAGTMPHYNTLGSYANMVSAILLALIIDYNEKNRRRYLHYGLAILAGAICIILSLSRGAMIAFVLSTIFIFAGSFYKIISARKLKILTAMLITGILVLSLTMRAIVYRFESAPESSGESREEYKQVARMMVHDHPWFGVGLNNFSHYAVTYYGPRYGLDEFGTPAHNIYFLTLAEGGIFTFILFLLVWIRFIVLGLKTIYQKKENFMASIVLGISCSFIVLAIQNWLEYVYRQTQIYFLYFTLAGLIVVSYERSIKKVTQSPPKRNRPNPWKTNTTPPSR